MLENFIKFIISIPIVFTLLFSSSLLWRLWVTQIDVQQTIKSWLGRQLYLSDWIATRDKNTIYQNGRIIGLVELDPIFEGNKIIFPRIRYVSHWDEKQFIDFRRLQCNKIVINEVEQVGGMEMASWYKNLQCEVVDNN